MNKSAEPQDLMQTNYTNAVLSWDSVLDTQTEIIFPFEYQFFLQSPEWMQARHILDAGCGNGTYIQRLQAFSPDKQFTGIDISEDLINIAKFNVDVDEIKFNEVDFFEHQPEQRYDVILMRLIVQHMKGLNDIFIHAGKITQENASLFIIEPEPHLFRNVPETPLFDGTLQKVEESSAKLKKNRGAFNELTETVRSLPDWDLHNDQIIVIPQTGPFRNSHLLQMYYLWVEIFENSKAFEYDYEAVRKELDLWGTKEISYSQFAIRIYHLKRK